MLKQSNEQSGMRAFMSNANMWLGSYILSPYASASYYSSMVSDVLQYEDEKERKKAMRESVRRLAESGLEHLLPYRIGIMQGESMASVKASGRGAKPLKAQLKGRFTQSEDSVYKQHKPYEIQTGLWQVEGTQTFFYGTLGISDEHGRISRDNADLIIVVTSDWKRLDVYVFKGLAGLDKQLDCLPEVVAYLKKSRCV